MTKDEEDALIQEAIYAMDCPVSGDRRAAIRLAIRAAVAAERERDEARELSVQGSARLFAAMNFERDEWKRKAEEAARDSARLDWMIEHGTDEGGGSGFEFRVYIPHDSECLRDAIDAAIAAKGEA